MAQHFIYAIVSILLFNQTIHADIVVLSSGERLEVTIVNRDETTLQVHHEILGDFKIHTKDIGSIEQSSPEKNETKATDVEESGKDSTKPEDSWNQNVRLGLGYQKAQNESSDISFTYHADHTEDEHKIAIDISYRFAESDDDRTLNRFASTLGNMWYQTDSRWDIFTNLQFDWAEFQSWDQRLLGDLGIQYELLKKKDGEHKFIFSTRIGSGFRQEFNSEEDELIPEGLLGIILDWTVSDQQAFLADSTWYPDYNDTSIYRIVTNAQWNLQLDSTNKLLFSVGLQHEYNSVVDPGIKKSDLQLTAGIKYLF